MRLLLLLSFVFFVLVASKTPPTFPSQFHVHYTFYDETNKRQSNVTLYWDMKIGSGRSKMVNTIKGIGTEISIANYDKLDFYFYKAYEPSCKIDYLVPPMRPYAVPSESVYIGSEIVFDLECDHWRYTWDTDKFHWVTDYYVTYTGSFYYPVRIDQHGNTLDTTTSHWDVPKVGPTDPIVYNVNSNWNCQP
ncbi:mammalian ependymin-related protein [Anaeramoeba flamelloides]|uniref:Mammalian ependymin-related protein n=1 Tax=Anaeramoeba flamelloides TaxID=1746091 RepID=A0AAV7ZZF7_9EUKA|nr:mammalian ependymin-related protein [Anaeramoeba flamelloides]KAJ6249787.1 mammalian ependymin-related protein [Anaeramoeba flamelloides]|eukprot:Anaeramoba_flamelloidesa584834_236.p1 GENE.a584834_236~~a584834_236.p1  ORF type:complete len:191 (+),score=25.12 a584834_236:3-575(+)